MVADIFKKNPFTHDNPLADFPNVDGVVALTQRLGTEAEVVFTGGCHTGPFFRYELPAPLAYLAGHLSR